MHAKQSSGYFLLRIHRHAANIYVAWLSATPSQPFTSPLRSKTPWRIWWRLWNSLLKKAPMHVHPTVCVQFMGLWVPKLIHLRLTQLPSMKMEEHADGWRYCVLCWWSCIWGTCGRIFRWKCPRSCLKCFLVLCNFVSMFKSRGSGWVCISTMGLIPRVQVLLCPYLGKIFFLKKKCSL